MLQTKKLVIYPTSRCVRQRVQKELKQDAILPKIITIGEFEKKAVIVKNRSFIDQDTRVLLLNEASSFSTFKELHIQREFFAFLKNSKFLFSFFDELSVELVDINRLQLYDTYASYAEHIEILTTLLNRYKQLLDQNNFVDKITLPSLYTLNLAYIKSFDEIELYLEGYLNNFEFKLLTEIAEIIPFKVHITTNDFNKKMIEKFKDVGINISNNHQYKINLSQKSIDNADKNHHSKNRFIVQSVQTQIEQVAFVKKKIYDYVTQGIEAENIAVILPNSNFAKLLEAFDDENNFNFAMGFSYKKSHIYQKLSAKLEYFSTKNHENRHRLKRFGIDLEKLQIEQERWNQKLGIEELQEIFKTFITDSEDEETLIYLEELHIFSKLFKNFQNQPFHKILHLFLNRLSTRTLDDTRGGKVTVLELLETRGVSFEAVIIVDFNEGVVPTSSQKDLFLSSELRYLSSLPTSTDRENLQKYYYKRVFDFSKHIAISYVEDEQNRPSRFLDELNIPKNSANFDNLNSILFDTYNSKNHFNQIDLILSYDFTKIKLSSTALKSYLDCKRSYYFRYIKKLKECEIPKDDNSDRVIGVLLHDGLKNVYSKKSVYKDADELNFEIQSHLYKESQNQANLRFLVDVWLEKLKPFIYNETKRAKEGYIVKYVEKNYDLKLDGFTLTGQIDRIDQKDNFFTVIDYKSGKITQDTQKSLKSTSNFQLQFYHLLTSQEAEVLQSYYYDLNSGELIADNFFDEKLDLLYQNLDSLKAKEHNFIQTDNLKKCIYCPYAKICDRIL